MFILSEKCLERTRQIKSGFFKDSKLKQKICDANEWLGHLYDHSKVLQDKILLKI